LLLPPGQELLAVDEEDAALATPQLAHARHLPTCRPALPVPCTESSQSGNLGYPHIPIVHSVFHRFFIEPFDVTDGADDFLGVGHAASLCARNSSMFIWWTMKEVAH